MHAGDGQLRYLCFSHSELRDSKDPLSTTLQCVSVSALIRYFGQFDLNAVKRFNRIRSSHEIVLVPLFLIGEWIIGMKEAKPWKNKRN